MSQPRHKNYRPFGRTAQRRRKAGEDLTVVAGNQAGARCFVTKTRTKTIATLVLKALTPE